MYLENLGHLTSFDISVNFVHGVLLRDDLRDAVIQRLTLFFESSTSNSQSNLENITIDIMCCLTGVALDPDSPDITSQRSRAEVILRLLSSQGWDTLDRTFSSQRFSKLKHICIRITIVEGYRGLQPLVRENRRVVDNAIEAFKGKVLADCRGSVQVHISTHILIDNPDAVDMDDRDRWLYHGSLHVGL